MTTRNMFPTVNVLGSLLAGAAALLLTSSLTNPGADRWEGPQRLQAFETRQKQIELTLIKQEKQNFLERQANPVLRATVEKNREAVGRARETLGISLDRYKSGIEPFIRDLRSWSTEFGVMAKSIAGWWYGDGRFDRFMEEKFAAHLFTDGSIAADVTNAQNQLVEDLEANRNELLIELRNASTSVPMKMPPAWPDGEAFGKEVSARARALVGHDTAIYEAGSNATAVIIPAVVDIAVQAAARAAATRAGGTVLAEMGTLAAGAGDGVAAGSEVPGVGNLIGFGVGLFVSALAMSYEQAKADDSLRHNIGDYIETLKTGIIGDETAPGEILRGMNAYVDEIDDAERRIVTQDVMALNDGGVK